jgi:hypothetical protein
MRDDKFVKSTLLGTMACLGASLEYSKQQNVALLAMMKEVLALRETVKALDPSSLLCFRKSGEKRRKKWIRSFPRLPRCPLYSTG